MPPLVEGGATLLAAGCMRYPEGVRLYTEAALLLSPGAANRGAARNARACPPLSGAGFCVSRRCCCCLFLKRRLAVPESFPPTELAPAGSFLLLPCCYCFYRAATANCHNREDPGVENPARPRPACSRRAMTCRSTDFARACSQLPVRAATVLYVPANSQNKLRCYRCDAAKLFGRHVSVESEQERD